MKRRLLTATLAAVLATACAQAAPNPQPAAAPAAAPARTADPAAARAEIDRLIARIQELSKQLGDDTRVRVEMHRFDGEHMKMPADGMYGPMPPMPPGEVRIERRFGGPDGPMPPMGAGIGIVMAPNAAATGVRVAAVTPDGPAAKAGLRSGDVILSVDGRKIAGSGDEAIGQARDLLHGLKKGQAVKLGYTRAGKTGVANVTADDISRVFAYNIERRDGDGEGHRFHIITPQIDRDLDHVLPLKRCAPDSKDCAAPALFEAFRWQGLNLASVDAALGRYFGTDHGVLVLSGGDELKGLQAGDVIQKVDGNAVASPRDVMRALRDRDEGAQVKFDVLRDRKAVAASVTVPKARPLPFMLPPPPPAPPVPPVPPVPPAPAAHAPGAVPPAPPAPPAAPAPPAPPQAFEWRDGDGAVVAQVIERRRVGDAPMAPDTDDDGHDGDAREVIVVEDAAQ